MNECRNYPKRQPPRQPPVRSSGLGDCGCSGQGVTVMTDEHANAFKWTDPIVLVGIAIAAVMFLKKK
jgi:hypothetical protein